MLVEGCRDRWVGFWEDERCSDFIWVRNYGKRESWGGGVNYKIV